MSSVVEICNSALSPLGNYTIGSLADDTKQSKLCNLKYEPVRDAVFRAFPWNCLQVRTSLARDTATPTSEYEYFYQLPTNPACLRVLRIIEAEDYDYDWKVEGRKIAIDAESCNIVYVAKITDPNQYDSLLKEAISARLGAEIAYALTGSASLLKSMWELYQMKVREARSVDSQEGTTESLINDEWMESRE
jgi:hypothetical protein